MGFNKIHLAKIVFAGLVFFPSLVSTSTSGLSRETQKAFELAQVYYGAPIFITSAYRSKEHNKEVGGAINSQHLFGRAIDVRLPTTEAQRVKLVWALTISGFTSIGWYSTHIHADIRRSPVFWKS